MFDWMPLVHIRRRIGVAAALYAGAHLLIYVLDQKWNLIVVATEIAKRFYLTIGFVALLALVALAVTSTDGWQKRLRRNWKRLHWLIYPGGLHRDRPFLHPVQGQDRRARLHRRPVRLADAVARAAGRSCARSYLGLVLLAVGATLATVVFEAAWYGLVNGIDPVRVLLANLDPELVPRPAHKVLIASLLVIVLVAAAPRLTLAANRLWTKRYIQWTIPTS